MESFGLTGIEIVFLVVAALVSVPFFILFRYIFREMKKDQGD